MYPRSQSDLIRLRLRMGMAFFDGRDGLIAELEDRLESVDPEALRQQQRRDPE